MKRPIFPIMSLVAGIAAAYLSPAADVPPGRIQDEVGRAGMIAVTLPANENHASPVIVLAGGANFPHAKPGAKTPEERGEKVFYDEIIVLDKPVTQDGAAAKPIAYGKLPRPVGYAAFMPTPHGLIMVGGCNAEGHIAKAGRIEVYGNELRMGALPDLPHTVAYPAFAIVGHTLYVIGGQEKPDSTTCLNSCYALDLNDPNAVWKEMAPMPGGRMLAAAGVVDGLIYVVGGCSLAPDEQGNGQRTYLKDVLCYDPGSNTWAKVAAEMPETIVGMANPLPVHQDKLYVVGGDPGDFYRASLEGAAPAEHPGQSKAVYSFTPAAGEWKKEGELPIGVATMPAVMVGGVIYTISGETHPGVRTPLIIPFKIN